MKIKKKELRKLEAELAWLRELADTRIRLTTPDSGDLLNVTLADLFLSYKVTGYDFFLARKYDAIPELPPATVADWINGPVKLLLEGNTS